MKKRRAYNGNYILILIGLFLIVTEAVSGQGWQWAKGTNRNNNYGQFCTTDTSGNIYAGGTTFNACYFLSDTIPNLGYARAYLVKYDSLGNLQWTNASSGRNSFGNLACVGVITDKYGDIYMLGAYDSVIAFGGHTLVNPYLNQYPSLLYYKAYLFLAKFNSTGDVLWVKNFGDFPASFAWGSNCMATDCNGDIYIASGFFKNATMGGTTFINSDASGETSDILVSKIDSGGNVMWAKSFGGDSSDHSVNLAVAPSKDIYFTGIFYHYQLTIGSDVLTDTGASHGYCSVFISKLDSAGNPLWTRSGGGGSNSIYITGLATNAQSDVYIAGHYQDAAFQLGSHSFPKPNGRYGYVAKYNQSGNLQWTKEILGINPYTEGIALDGCENLWVLGHLGFDFVSTNDTIDGHVIIPPVKNKYPIFLAGWSASGGYIGTSALASGGGSGYQISIASGKSDDLYIIGNNRMDTLMISGDMLFSSSSISNMFVAKYKTNLDCHKSHALNCISKASSDLVAPKTEVDIYPNPVISELHIKLPDRSHGKSYKILNLVGRELMNGMLNKQDNELYLETLPTGIYILEVYGDNGKIAVKKIVKRS